MRQEIIQVCNTDSPTILTEVFSALEDGGRIVTSFIGGNSTFVVVEFDEEWMPPKYWGFGDAENGHEKVALIKSKRLFRERKCSPSHVSEL